MKKLLSILLSCALVFGFLASVAGCGGSAEDNKTLTRIEWVSALAAEYNLEKAETAEPFFSDVSASNPYFGEVQACAEWELIEKSDELNPSEAARADFCEISAVKAIGLELLEKSDYKASLGSDGEILAFFKKQSKLNLGDSKAVTQKAARKILAAAQKISEGLVLPQVYEIDYKENVRELSAEDALFSADGRTATLKDSGAVVGDIIAIDPCEYFPEGKYIKITEKNGSKIVYSEAEIDEICSSYDISGTFEPKVISALPLSSGVTVTQLGEKAVNTPASASFETPAPSPMVARGVAAPTLAGVYTKGNAVGFSVNDGPITGSVEMSFDNVTVDVGLTKAYLRIDDTLKTSITIANEFKKSIPLASVGLTIAGVASITADLRLDIGFKGKITVGVEVKTSETFEASVFGTPKVGIHPSEPEVNSHVDAAGYARPNLCASLKVLSHKVAWVGVYSGIEGKLIADASLSAEAAQSCIDIKLWVPLTVYYGYDLLLKSGSDDKKFWTEDDSVWSKHWHFENGNKVEKCTVTGKKTDENFTPIGDKNGGGSDEYSSEGTGEPLAFSSLGGALMLSSFYAAMNPSLRDKLSDSRLPEGYSAGDIVFSSNNTGAVTVDSSGNISAKESGYAIVKAATKDGRFEQFCAVSILQNYFVEFSPISPKGNVSSDGGEGAFGGGGGGAR